MKNPLKHKGAVEVKQEIKKEYLERSKIENNCISHMLNDEQLQLTNKTIVEVYRISFIKENGIDKHVDKENKDILNHVVSIIRSPYKVYIFNERKEMLKTNISFFEQKKKENPYLEDIIQNRLEIMYLFEEIKYKTFYIMIDIKCQDFYDNASRVLNLEKIVDKELISFARTLNNLV